MKMNDCQFLEIQKKRIDMSYKYVRVCNHEFVLWKLISFEDCVKTVCSNFRNIDMIST